MSSALKAGWICFGIGLAISWFFPFGHIFFSVGMITAVVAMCTHQVNRGLGLLISSFVGSALCVLVFFTLVLGTLGVATGAALKQAKVDIQRQQAQQRRALTQLNTASQQLQTAMTTTTIMPITPRISTNVLQQTATSSFDQQQQYELAMVRKRDEQQRAAADERKRQQNVQEAQRQANIANGKEQERQRLQNSVDWWDSQVKNARLNGSDSHWLEAQRDNAWKQKQDFEHK